MPLPSAAWLAAALAPGALVALAAVLLRLALGRWYDPLPRRVLAAFGLGLVLCFGEALLGGRLLLPLDGLRGEPPFEALPATEPHGNLIQGDLLYLVHPLGLEVRRAVVAGAWPLWSPRLGAGMPLLADPQAQALQPLAAAGLLLPPETAPGAVAALRTLVALAFSYLLLRRLGAGVGPALAAALAFGFGGFLQLWLGWPLANTAALLPAALYALLLAADRGERRDWALLAGCLAALLLAGHPETIAYGLALVAGLALVVWHQRWRRRLFLSGRGRRPGVSLFPRFGRRGTEGEGGSPALAAAAAAVLALLLTAPALLPFAEYLPETVRWSRARAAPASAESSGQAAVPGRSEASGEVPPATRLVQASAPNALGNSRFARYWGLRNSNEDAAGFAGTATLLAALLALPGWLSRRRPLRHEGATLALAGACLTLLALPGGFCGWVPERAFSGRLALPLGLALAVLAAATLERFRQAGLPAWLPWAALPSVVLALALLHFWAVPAFVHPGDPAALDVLRRGWLHWHLRFLGGAGLLLFLGGTAAVSLGRRRRLLAFVRPAWVAPAIALLIGAELFLAHRPVNPAAPAALYFPATPSLTFLEGALAEGPDAPRITAVGRVLLPNAAAVYGLSDARVFSPMAPAAYLAALEPGVAWIGEIPLLAGDLDRGVHDRLGIAWVLTAPGAPCPAGSVPAYAGADAGVCRRLGALPLLRLAAPDDRAAAAQPLAELEVAADPSGDRWSARLPDGQGGRLETGIYAAPGWRLLADGRPTPLALRPDGTPLLAADLPPGTRRVDLLYRPAGFVLGCLAAAIALALSVAWLARPPAT
jgi:hypothetical protein